MGCGGCSPQLQSLSSPREVHSFILKGWGANVSFWQEILLHVYVPCCITDSFQVETSNLMTVKVTLNVLAMSYKAKNYAAPVFQLC